MPAYPYHGYGKGYYGAPGGFYGGAYPYGHGPNSGYYGAYPYDASYARRMSKSPVRKTLDVLPTDDYAAVTDRRSTAGRKSRVPTQEWNGYTSQKDRLKDEEKMERSERRKAYDQSLRDSRG